MASSFIAQENRFEGAAATAPPADGHSHVAVVDATTGEIQPCDDGDFGAKWGNNPDEGVYVMSPDGQVDTLKSGTPTTLTITKSGGLGSANPIVVSTALGAMTGTAYTSLCFNASGARTDVGSGNSGVLYKTSGASVPSFTNSITGFTINTLNTITTYGSFVGNLTGTASLASSVPGTGLTGGSLATGITSSSLTGVGTITSGTWNGTAIDSTYLSPIPWTKLTSTPTMLKNYGVTSDDGTPGYVLKSNGTGSLATWESVGSVVGGAELKVANGGNITLAVSGTPSTALLNTATITAGWSGVLSVANGGTNLISGVYSGGSIYAHSTTEMRCTTGATSNKQALFATGAGAAPAYRVIASSDLPTTITGLTSVVSDGFTGALAGNASTATTLSGILTTSLGGTGANIDLSAVGKEGGVIYADTTTAMACTAAGTSGQPLISGGVAGTPQFTTLELKDANITLGTPLSVTRGGTGNIAGWTTAGVLYANSSTVTNCTSAGTTGSILYAGANSYPAWVPGTPAIGQSLFMDPSVAAIGSGSERPKWMHGAWMFWERKTLSALADVYASLVTTWPAYGTIRDIQVRVCARSKNGTANLANLRMRINGSSSSIYRFQQNWRSNSTSGGVHSGSVGYWDVGIIPAYTGTYPYGIAIVTLLDVSSSVDKSGISEWGVGHSGGGSWSPWSGHTALSTTGYSTAITSISLASTTYDFDSTSYADVFFTFK